MTTNESNKRGANAYDDDDRPVKRGKGKMDGDNFFKIVKKLSQNAYFNLIDRFKLMSVPSCNTCNSNNELSTMSPEIKNDLNEELKAFMWYEALETIFLSITPTQYLPASILTAIVKIMLNTHGDNTSNYNSQHIINQCQKVLAYNFKMHPPCYKCKHDIIKCYKDFLNNSLEEKFDTNTNLLKSAQENRVECNYRAGIVMYCFTRLEYEIQDKCDDSAYIKEKKMNDDENEKTDSKIKFLFCQQEKFEIFEILDRRERIDRLMAILYSIIQLIQFDLYSSKCYNSKDCLLLLWCGREPCKLSKPIMRLFAYFIHLGYPEQHIHTLSLWLNAVVEFYYFQSEKSDSDYPIMKLGVSDFRKEFLRIIWELTHQSIIKILDKIEPTYMRYEMCIWYSGKVYQRRSFESFVNFIIEKIKSDSFMNEEVKVMLRNTKNVASNDITKNFSDICKYSSSESCDDEKELYPRHVPKYDSDNAIINQNDFIMQFSYTTLQASLDVFNIREVHKILFTNTHPSMKFDNEISYSITTDLVKRYKEAYDSLILLNDELERNNDILEMFECFRI